MPYIHYSPHIEDLEVAGLVAEKMKGGWATGDVGVEGVVEEWVREVEGLVAVQAGWVMGEVGVEGVVEVWVREV